MLVSLTVCRWRGDVKKWYKFADTGTKHLAKDVNGPLLASLARQIGYDDLQCIDFFRDGNDMQTVIAFCSAWYAVALS